MELLYGRVSEWSLQLRICFSMFMHLWTGKVIRRLCLCVCVCVCAFACMPLSLQQFSAVLILHTHTHAALQAPLRTDRGKSSDADKWARSGTDSPAGNTAVKPAAASTAHRK